MATKMEVKTTNKSQRGPPGKHVNLIMLKQSTTRCPRPETNIRLSVTGAPKVARCTPGPHFGDFGKELFLANLGTQLILLTPVKSILLQAPEK